MEEGITQAQVTAACAACARMTVLHLTELHDSVERACRLNGRSHWARKAAAHAEIFSLLADMVDDPLLAPLLTGCTVHVREVMLAIGRVADGMTVSSRRRLLAHLRAGDGDAAALEMERHLRSLLYMRRLLRPGSQVIAGKAPL
jgi:DNA-binding FadR family transcriptional regulator